jgi:hypothetical protein
MNSDTPRTDNAAPHGGGTTVPADFAADLEFELNEAKAEVERLREVLIYSLDNQGRYLKKHQKIVDAALKETK